MTGSHADDAATIARDLRASFATAEVILSRLIGALEGLLERGLEGGFIRPLDVPTGTPRPAIGRSGLPASAAAHRREHRCGVPSRIAADPEVQAFICGVIDTMTYDQVVAAVAGNFPPSRVPSRSSLQRWWRRRCPRPPA